MNFRNVTINTAFPGPAHSRVMILYTGGTFGMTQNADGVLVPFDFAHILEHLPTLRNLSLDLTVISFDQPIDSSNIDPSHWQLMARVLFQHRESQDGFVVLHGTDTMAYTASALSFMLPDFGKPVVFTGAQLPISHPRSDARENLITALEMASARNGLQPMVPEVCIYFGSELLRGNRSKKVESMHFDAFQSENYPPLAKAGVRIAFNESVLAPVGPLPRLLDLFDTGVAIIKMFPGISVASMKSLLQAPCLKAVILETFGSGNAPTHPDFLEQIKAAIGRGLLVVNVSQCPGGMVIQGKYETSRHLLELGVLGGADMTTEAAVTKAMILLGNYPVSTARELLVRNLAGELTEAT
jgi:L-asparaginase